MRNTLRWFLPLTPLVAAVFLILPITSATPPSTHPPADLPTSSAKDLPVLDVSFMVRGYFMAGSPIADPEALGGFGESGNLPRKINREVPRNALSLIALPEESVPFGEYRGFHVLLANTTGKRVAFEASDSRLSLIREAVDPQGEWKPIEYLPSSWCGNSYHQVFLPSGQFWSFSAPVYQGSLATRMRFVLVGMEGGPLYSDEFDGFVNPEQFTAKQGHTPTSIMDPYED